MKNNGWLLKSILLAAVFAAVSSFGQAPPPNDNYSNSITLTGTDVTFSGTLAGATLESAGNFVEDAIYDTPYPLYTGGGATESVWWNWTAPVSTVLTFQVLSSSPAYPEGTDEYGSANSTLDGLFVYTATNGSTTPAGLVLPPVGMQLMDMFAPPVTLSVPVIAGANYQIQLIGSSSASYTFHMVATNVPVIVRQPKSHAVYSNTSCLFYVIADGLEPTNFTYQWLFNGNPITNQTAPMLALTNIDGTMAGSYSVLVSNVDGFTVSQPATLTVSQTNVPISLSVIGMVSSNFLFSLTGENGRNYRIESSTDLIHWVPEVSFAFSPLEPNRTSVIFNSNSPTLLTVPRGIGRKFFRATPYVAHDPVAELCINNMREIQVATILFQHYEDPYVYDLSHGPQPLGLIPFFPNQTGPLCPIDTWDHFFTDTYELGSLAGLPPNCLLAGVRQSYDDGQHVLEDPQ